MKIITILSLVLMVTLIAGCSSSDNHQNFNFTSCDIKAAPINSLKDNLIYQDYNWTIDFNTNIQNPIKIVLEEWWLKNNQNVLKSSQEIYNGIIEVNSLTGKISIWIDSSPKTLKFIAFSRTTVLDSIEKIIP